MADKIFPKGIYAKAPHEKVKGWTATTISIKVADAIPWLKEHENVGGYVNLNVKFNEKGMYIEKDTWTPTKDKASEEEKNQQALNNFGEDTIEYPADETSAEDVPF